MNWAMNAETEAQVLRIENAYLRGKIEAYENVLGLKGFIEQKECDGFKEGLDG